MSIKRLFERSDRTNKTKSFKNKSVSGIKRIKMKKTRLVEVFEFEVFTKKIQNIKMLRILDSKMLYVSTSLDGFKTFVSKN